MTLKVAIALVLVPGLAAAQSLGEAARKEKERRKQLEAAGVKPRELTDKDLRSGKGTLANEPGNAEPAAASSTPAQASTAGKEDENRRREEAQWRQRAARARARVDATRQEYEYLNGLSITHGELYVDEKGKPVITSLEQLRGRIAKAKAEWEAAEKAWEDLQDSARRQNVPPGWLR